MTDTLAHLLRREADRHEPPLIFGPALRARAQARPRRRLLPITLAVLATAAAVIAGIILLPAVSRDVPLPPADQLTSWPTRGDLATDASLALDAKQTWDAAPLVPAELPHQDVQILYAASTLAGKVVVLTGRNALGHQRWAILNQDATSTTPYRHRLRLVLDQPLDLRHARQLSWQGWRPTPRPNKDRLFVLLTPPGSSTLGWKVGDVRGSFSSPDNGAAAEVFDTVSVEERMSVSWRSSGKRHRESASEVSTGRSLTIQYLEDADARPEGADSDACSAAGDVVNCRVGVEGTIDVGPSARETLAQPYVTEGTWGEYASEIELAWLGSTKTRPSFWSGGPRWSGLLPDGTGGALHHGTVGRGNELVLYADHPSGHGGRLFAIRPVTGRVPVLTAVVPGEEHPWLMAPAVTGWQVDVREGSGKWIRASEGDGVRYAPLTGRGKVQVRLISPTGTVGKPSAPDGQ